MRKERWVYAILGAGEDEHWKASFAQRFEPLRGHVVS
jgi:hypothetical protein